MPGQGRKLAAIMFTDIVGYSSIMQKDEARGRLVRERHKNVFEQSTARYQGEIIQYYGDGTLSAFQSAVSAVECAVKMQQQLRTYPQVPLRIGIHLGDIHYDETEVYGHGVNIAARLEPICTPGGIFISGKVHDEIRNHTWLKAASLGVYHFKNIDQPIEVYAVQDKGVAFPSDDEVVRIQARVKRMEMSDISQRSEAMQKFLKREKRARRRKFMARFLIAAVVVLLISLLANVDAFLTGERRGTSIAVLPFNNLSQTQENEYFSDGMTEDILTRLSRIQDFSVTSRTSVMQYKNTTKPIPQIADELGVDHILEGSVRREGDQVRINAQLIDARDDRHIWAHTYDEQIVNIFDVQMQVARDIADQLRIQLSPKDKENLTEQQTTNSVAYDLYLKGREYYRKYTPEDNDQAISLFKRALDIDPKYALAMAGLGDAFAQRAIHVGDMERILDSAVLMSSLAIETDPGLSEGYKALGLAFHYQDKLPEAITQYKKALELDPSNDMAAHNLSQIELQRGNYVEAAKWASKNLEINKTVPSSTIKMAELYMVLGDVETANRLLKDGLEINPDAYHLRSKQVEVMIREGNLAAALSLVEELIREKPEMKESQELLALIYLFWGKWEAAGEHFNRELELIPETKPVEASVIEAIHALAEALHVPASQREEALKKVLEKLDKIEPQEPNTVVWVSITRAATYTYLGNTAKALAAINEAREHHFYDYTLIRNNSIFEPIQNSPEFRALIQDIKQDADSILTAIRTELSDGT